MAVAVRVLLALSVIAQVCAAAAIRHRTDVYQTGKYAEFNRAGLLALAAVAVLLLVAFTLTGVSAMWLWDEGGGWGWPCWAAGLLCLVAQCFALESQRTVVYLVLAVAHVVFGLVLSTSVWRTGSLAVHDRSI